MGMLSKFSNRSDEVSSEESTDEGSDDESTTSSQSETEDEASAESDPTPKGIKKQKSKKKNVSKLWQNNLSARSNQDMQRAYEEKVLREATCILNKSAISDTVTRSKNASKNVTPLGGLWVRLETEWREGSFQTSHQVKSKSIFTHPKINNRTRTSK